MAQIVIRRVYCSDFGLAAKRTVELTRCNSMPACESPVARSSGDATFGGAVAARRASAAAWELWLCLPVACRASLASASVAERDVWA
jgi:hypothetical protein